MALRLAAERAALHAPPEGNVGTLPAVRAVQAAQQLEPGIDAAASPAAGDGDHGDDFYADALETVE